MLSQSSHSGSLRLLAGPPARSALRLQRLVAALGLRGPLRLLVCGNHFDPYTQSYHLARRGADYHAILDKHIMLARAETPHQMLALLQGTPADPIPTLAGDLLAPLSDEGLPAREADEIFFLALLELKRLKISAPLIVSAVPNPARPEPFYALQRAADVVRLC